MYVCWLPLSMAAQASKHNVTEMRLNSCILVVWNKMGVSDIYMYSAGRSINLKRASFTGYNS